jgi:hypothetical protein
MSFIAGAYTVTYNGMSVGQIEAGTTLEWLANKRLITGDNQGDSPQDAVYRGHDVHADFILMEYNASAAAAAFWPYSGTFGTQGTVGRLDVGSSLAKALVLTAVAGTPAAATPASLTAATAILAEGFPVRVLFAPDLRDIPLRMRIYPSVAGVFWSTT